MARIEYIELRLKNWALWKARENANGLGFYKSSSFLGEPARGGYRESIIPVDEVDASVTNQAVESLKATRGQLYQVLQCMYVQGIGIKGTAGRLGKAPSTIYAQLDQADLALSQWFTERAEQHRKSSTTYKL